VVSLHQLQRLHQEEMATRALRSNPQRRVELYNQFLIDVSRVRVFVDGKLHSAGPAELALLILNSTKQQPGKRTEVLAKECSEDQAFHLLYLCTQGVLADLYQEAVTKWCKHTPDAQLHLLGDGDHRVDLCLADRTVAQTKVFRLVEMSADGEAKEHMRLSLSLFVDARNPSARQHAWATTELSDEWLLVNLLESGDGVCERSSQFQDMMQEQGVAVPTLPATRRAPIETPNQNNSEESSVVVVDGIAGLVGEIRSQCAIHEPQLSNKVNAEPRMMPGSTSASSSMTRRRRRMYEDTNDDGDGGDAESVEDLVLRSISNFFVDGVKGVCSASPSLQTIGFLGRTLFNMNNLEATQNAERQPQEGV
jgi:hypothetical protein